MSSEVEIDKSVSNDLESFRESEKRSKIAYSRDFLLSLSDLDVCKSLPSGFDSSLLSEFEDSYHGSQDRLRNHGSLPLQSHRRTDYSSSPPTRGDASNYSRGVYGRWDNRPPVRSGRDSDSQSDKDSVADSGRASGNQFRKPWQSSEHDGLLGSGSFARPPGFAAGLSGPKGRFNDQYQPKKSNEPYQPPRPYKAGPLSRRELTDSLNDETFGSADCASQDQAEEEKRRRESFELMRKEQHKSLQEKQNITTDKHKVDHISNFKELIGESATGNRNLDEPVTQSVSNNDSSKTSLQASVVRPLVPPGFRSAVAEKSSSVTSVVQSDELEAGILGVKESVSLAKTIAQDGVFDNQEERLVVAKMGPQHLDARVRTSEKSETQGVLGTVKGDTKKATGKDFIDPTKQAQQPSILDQLFGSVVSENLFETSDLVKKQDAEEDDPWSQTNASQSSKFAQWFSKDGIPPKEKKVTEDQECARPTNLLSIIGGGEKSGPKVDLKLSQQIPSDSPFQGSGVKDGFLTSDTMNPSVGIPKELHKKSSKVETVPPILTCEDLEQTILSGYSGKSSTSQQSLEGHNVFGTKEPSKAEADNQASHHLLSLLKMGPAVTEDKVAAPIAENVVSGGKVETITESGKPLTLETLFGSAFMKELQSAEAPVSALGSAAKSGINGPNSKVHSKSDDFRGLFGMYDSQVESHSSKQRTDLLSKHGGFDERSDIPLPEEGNLLGVGDPVNSQSSVFNPFGNLITGEPSRPVDISDKLAALAAGFNKERPAMHGRHGSLDHEIPFHNRQTQSQMNHAGPFFQQLESHPTHASPPMNFMTPEGMIQRGGSMSHQLPVNMVRPPFRYPSGGGQTGLEPPHPILQQMQQMQVPRPTPNNFPQHLQEYNRGAPMPSHLRTRPAGQVQDRGPMQGFTFEQQHNFAGPGMAVQASGVSGNHPEALQKLLEMEMRANSAKRMHPFGNNSQGLHGHDSDGSFRYRI